MEITFELSEADLGFFREAMLKSRERTGGLDESAVVENARQLLQRIARSDTSDFIREHMSRLETLIGTKNAYKGTLHVSNGVGAAAFFRFIGTGFLLGYQRGTNFGTVMVLIDDQPYSFHEQAFDLVGHSPQLSPGDHFVRIIHESGESINLDYIEILP